MSEEDFYNKLKYNFFGSKDSKDFKELIKAYNDKNKEIERLHSIIKEAIEYINRNTINSDFYKVFDGDIDDLLEILKGE